MKLPFTVGNLPMTKAFITHIISLNVMSTLLHVSLLLGLDWKTVKNIDKAHLKKRPKQFSYKKLKYLSIDEIAIRKGHRYMTIISDIQTGQIIYAVKGRKDDDICGFLKKLKQKARGLKGIAMDMSRGYTAAVTKYLPHVPIIFDRFHVTKVLTKMVDDVRKHEWKKCQKQGINLGKGERFLFLRNKKDLDSEETMTLEKILEINKDLATTHMMKEQFRAFWECETKEEAGQFFIDWFMIAGMSGIPELCKAAKTLLQHIKGLLNYFDHRINNGKAEGINNKIKTMKRQSYGFRDFEYFTLKLYNLHKTQQVLVGAVAA